MQTIDEVEERLAETLEEIRKDTEERAESYRKQIEEVCVLRAVMLCYVPRECYCVIAVGIPWTTARAEGVHRF